PEPVGRLRRAGLGSRPGRLHARGPEAARTPCRHAGETVAGVGRIRLFRVSSRPGGPTVAAGAEVPEPAAAGVAVLGHLVLRAGRGVGRPSAPSRPQTTGNLPERTAAVDGPALSRRHQESYREPRRGVGPAARRLVSKPAATGF